MPVLQTPSLDSIEKRQPIILLGMHRSGTSLVSRLFMISGIHMGCDLDPNAESKHLRSFNKRIFRAVGAEWNTPQRVIESAAFPEFVTNQADYIRSHVLTGVGGLRYWGVKRWLSLRGGADPPFWGWKDPRTSLTLPIWMRLFPEAQVLHIIRNGIDVAISLHRRHLDRNRRRRVHPDHRDPRGFDFRFCFSLWETYQSHLLTYRNSIPSEQYHEIRYETLLREPETVLRSVLPVLGVPVDEPALSKAITTINTGRLDNRKYAASYQDIIPELEKNPLMCELGYPESR